MNTFSKPKKLLVCMLAAAMGASALAGGMLLNANAAEGQVESKALFTASEGVTVTPASQYELKSDVEVDNEDGEKETLFAGEKVGDEGLRFQSQNDGAFTIDVNGVFFHSFGLEWSAPADRWVDGGAEVVFEIAEYGNPDNKFEIHYAGPYQSGAWIEYDYTDRDGNTQTLYRTYGYSYNINQGTDQPEKWVSRMIYDQSMLSDPIGNNFEYYPCLTTFSTNAKSRMSINVQKSTTDGTSVSTDTQDAIINIIGNSRYGGNVTMASFRDDPETFTPTTEKTKVYSEQTYSPPTESYNLPRINFNNGYTVKIHVSAGLEFMAYNVAEIYTEAWQSDPWYWDGTPKTDNASPYDITGNMASNTSPQLFEGWTEKLVTPLFYQNWLTAPFINISEYESVVAAGTAFTPPEATYANNGTPETTSRVPTVEYRVNGGEWTDVSTGTIPAQKAGSEVEVRYSVPYNETTITETIQLTVRNIPTDTFSTEKVLRTDNTLTPNTNAVSNGGATTSSEKGLLVDAGEEGSYSFDLVGRFTGNTEIRWGTAAENDWAVNGSVTFTIAEAGNPENCFKVVWRAPHQSPAYVEYVYNDTTLYCARDQYGGDKFYYTYDGVTNANNVQYLPTIGQASSSGILGLEWAGDVLNIMVTNRYGSKQNLASFLNDTTDFQPVTTGTGATSNLPKISFDNGYTVSVDVEGPIDFMLYGVTTAEDTTSFAAETLDYEPVWYTLGARMPVFGELAQIPGVQYNATDNGNQIAVPPITYTTAAKEGEATLKIEWIKPDKTTTTVTKEQQLPLSAQGDHILRYTVTVDNVDYTRELTVHACDYNAYVTGTGTPATCSATGNGDFSCEHGYTINKEIPIDPDAHSYGEPEWTWTEFTGATVKLTCTACSDEKTETASIESEETKAATCTEAGVRTYTATVTIGEETYTDTKTETIPATAHKDTMQHVEAKEAGCTENGNVEYWYCSACKGYFEDAQGSKPTTLEAVTIPASGAHSYGEPDWKWTGVTKATAEFTCSACGDVQTVNATITNKVTKEATCETAGERTYTATATFGGKTYTDTKTETIAATGHHMVQVPAKAATCTENGNSAYYKCSECGRCTSDSKGEMEIDESTMILKAKGHSFEEGVCTVCGAEDPDYVPETGLTGGEIAGIVIACVAVAGGGVALAVVLIRKKKLTK